MATIILKFSTFNFFIDSGPKSKKAISSHSLTALESKAPHPPVVTKYKI